MLTLLASFAQEESRSISENVKWGAQKRYQQGIPNGHFFVIGYRWTEDHNLYIYEPEAAIVRRIFKEYLNGAETTFIASTFNNEGMKTPWGNPWRDSNINKILTNTIYIGELVFQKSYTPSIGAHTQVNKGVLPKYVIEDHHPAIISKKDFQKVQEEFQRRHNLGFKANNAVKNKISCFSGIIECSECGRHFVHSIKKNKLTGKYKDDNWVCTTTKKAHWNKKRCSIKPIPAYILKRKFIKLAGIPEFDEKLFTEQIEKIKVLPNNTLEFHFKNGEINTTIYELTGHKDCWTEEYRKEHGEKMRIRFARERMERQCRKTSE